MRITLQYGITKLENVTVDEETVVGGIIDRFGPALGLPESVDAVIDGEVVDSYYTPRDGDTVEFEKRACAKA
jgi:hypothetical protein